jgi:hypothetical protein
MKWRLRPQTLTQKRIASGLRELLDCKSVGSEFLSKPPASKIAAAFYNQLFFWKARLSFLNFCEMLDFAV